MKLDKFLYRNSFLAFIIFFAFALWAFWPSYYSTLDKQPNYRNHTHGIGMTLWCVMLILQAYLIRIKKRNLHKSIGKFAYVLVPFIIIATVDLVKSRMGGIPSLSNNALSFIALVLNSTLVFVILFCLAIYHKKKPLVHARYMICTIFPMLTPISDRIISRHFRHLVQYAPTIDGNPILPVLGFVIADVILLVLIIWDWRQNQRKWIFLTSFVIILLFQISVMTLHHSTAWKTFSEWFLNV